ncbi:hypothetical protein PtA15_6A418 [Puccinia triticina]|uniref:Uncharacterized protein n=1 Tax=Puccinia triticina TaxID=208348 RepID=A0ABY7CKX3_9BASI|nr:uncharacterized protein PtA15_6A418 [Puccinia triticina]WAQ85789.1 hypothetical protein PtA15_6A418 [Puccinia triticina]
MHQFQVLSHTLLRMAEERMPGIGQTTAPLFSNIGDTSGMTGAEIAVLTGELTEVGWAALKRMDALMKNKTHMKAFIKNSDELSMLLLKEQSFEIVGMLENANILAAQKQIQ